ncbi:MAG: trigger factor [Syntrophobacteraceae bacterium]
MNVSVEDLSVNQKKLKVIIPALQVQQEIEKRYREVAGHARIKGFRPGKVPRAILKSYYGKTIEQDVSSHFIQETFPEALRESELKPLAEADVSESCMEEDGAFKYVAIVDVSPPFQVEEYKGLKITRPPISFDESKVEDELQRLRERHAQIRAMEEDRPVQEGDIVFVDFIPHIDGKVFDKGKTKDYMLEVGKNVIHPDFDQFLVGYRAGEVVSFDLDYPEDVSKSELAGKRVHFETTIRDVKEKILPELNDDFALEVGQYETMDALRQEISDQLNKREEDKQKAAVRQQIMEHLLSKTQIEVSQKVIEREVDRLVEILQSQFKSQGLNVGDLKFDSPEFRAGYYPQAEKNVRWHLMSHWIAEQENIELTEDDLEQVYNEVAGIVRVDVEKLKSDYLGIGIIEQAKESKFEEKVFKFLEDEVCYVEASEEATSTDQE